MHVENLENIQVKGLKKSNNVALKRKHHEESWIAFFSLSTKES